MPGLPQPRPTLRPWEGHVGVGQGLGLNPERVSTILSPMCTDTTRGAPAQRFRLLATCRFLIPALLTLPGPPHGSPAQLPGTWGHDPSWQG